LLGKQSFGAVLLYPGSLPISPLIAMDACPWTVEL
jgi:hypothetical protein